MKARGLDSPDIGDCLTMSHSEKIAATRKPEPKLIYSFPGQAAGRWMA
jgi:hypothetical protein